MTGLLRALGVVAALGLSGAVARGQTLATFSFTGQPGDQVSQSAASATTGLSAANSLLTRGAGIDPTTAANTFISNGFTVSGTLANAVATNEYVSITLRTTTAGTFDFTSSSLSFTTLRSSTGPANIDLRAGFDGFTAQIGTTLSVPSSSAAVRSFSLNDLGTQSVGANTDIEFRIYGYGATNVGGTFRLQNSLTVGGTFTPVPEPATVLAAAAAGLALLRRRHSQPAGASATPNCRQ